MLNGTHLTVLCPNCAEPVDVLGTYAETIIGCSPGLPADRIARRFLPQETSATCDNCSTRTEFRMANDSIAYEVKV